MFANIGHLKEIAVQTRPFHRTAEGGFVHPGRTRCYNDTIQVIFVRWP